MKLTENELKLVMQTQPGNFAAATLVPYVPRPRKAWKWVAAIAIALAAVFGYVFIELH